jgi:parvulin-like peptidyl-prolyl isomerase
MKLSFGWVGIVLGLIVAGGSVVAVKLRNERPVVIVNGEKISRAKFVAELEKEQGADVLRRLIQERLVLQAAKRKGVLPTPAQVKAELARLREADPDMDRQLRLRGKSMEELEDDLNGRLAMAHLIAADVKVPDAEVKKLWTEYQQKFNRPEGRRVSMVVAKTSDIGEKARGLILAGTPAEFVVQSGGMALPARRSQINVYHGQLPAPIEARVFRMKKGEVSGVLPMGKVFAVVKVLDVLPAQKKSFDEVKDRLILAAKVSKGKNQAELLQDLQKTAKIDFQSHRYVTIMDQPSGPSGAPSDRMARAK